MQKIALVTVEDDNKLIVTTESGTKSFILGQDGEVLKKELGDWLTKHGGENLIFVSFQIAETRSLMSHLIPGSMVYDSATILKMLEVFQKHDDELVSLIHSAIKIRNMTT